MLGCHVWPVFPVVSRNVVVILYLQLFIFYLRLANTTNVLYLPVLLNKVLHFCSTNVLYLPVLLSKVFHFHSTNVLYLPVLLSIVFHFRSTLLPCLGIAFFTHFTSNLLEDVPVPMRTIQAALYTFIAPYTNKRSCFFDTPAITHFVYFHVNPRANVIIRARIQAHVLNTNTRNIHVITGLWL